MNILLRWRGGGRTMAFWVRKNFSDRSFSYCLAFLSSCLSSCFLAGFLAFLFLSGSVVLDPYKILKCLYFLDLPYLCFCWCLSPGDEHPLAKHSIGPANQLLNPFQTLKARSWVVRPSVWKSKWKRKGPTYLRWPPPNSVLATSSLHNLPTSPTHLIPKARQVRRDPNKYSASWKTSVCQASRAKAGGVCIATMHAFSCSVVLSPTVRNILTLLDLAQE